jgi:hypothetical protein
MSYIGNTPTTQSFISGTDYFNGTGAQTAFTLSRTVASVNDIEAVVNNVVQQPNDAYTISGTTITFTSAPSAGTSNVYVRYLSTTTQAITPSQGTVSWSTLDSNVQGDLGISFKNRIINGNMTIDQRNAGASVTASTTGSLVYTLDRWAYYAEQASKFTVQQDAGAVTPPSGFNDYLGITSSSAYSPISTDQFIIRQNIEGFNSADLSWGTANAKTVTLSFWVRSSLTGTFAGNVCNSNGTRSYIFSYTINSANTWEYKTTTIVGDAAGTWLTTNGVGISLNFALGTGSSYQSAAGVWNAGYKLAPSGAIDVVGTNGATWYITGVQLEVGTQATTFTTAGGSYGAELALCQRYYENSYNQGNTPQAVPTNFANSYAFLAVGSNTFAGGVNAAQQTVGPLFYKATKRAAPTVTIYSYTSSTTSVASNGWTGADLAASTGSLGDNYTYGFTIINKNGSNASTGGYGIIFGFAASAEL